MSAVVYQLENCSQDPKFNWGHCHLHKKCLAQEVCGAEIHLTLGHHGPVPEGFPPPIEGTFF